MIVIDTHIVPPNISAVRLSDYAVGIFLPIPTRKGIKKAIKKGAVRVDGEIATTGKWVETGQVIELLDLETSVRKPYRMSLEVVYEDNDMAVINKPSGVVVNGNQFRTIQNALPYNLGVSDAVDAFAVAQPVHRLDSSTSGLLLVAKTRQARTALGKQFEQRLVHKQYQAVVIGATPKTGSIDIPIDGKSASTQYELITQVRSLKNEYLSLLNLFPITGRTHQLRIHLAEIGFPILGDKLYGKEGFILKGKGLFLSAVGIKFMHPTTGEKKEFAIPMPQKFNAFMEGEQRRWERFC